MYGEASAIGADRPVEVVKALWRGADRKGCSVPMTSSASDLLEEYDEMFETLPAQSGFSFDSRQAVAEAERPIGLRFEFIEVCGGSGVVTKELIKLGVVCDIVDPSQKDRVVMWIIFMMEDGRLESYLVAPPCTSFSPACHPALRSYALPRGFNPLHPKVHLGNCLAFVALTLLYVALRLGVFGIGEQPRRSKMRWLREWRRLVDLGATEVTLASCSYGSHHQKHGIQEML